MTTNTPAMPPIPEHDKLRKVQNESQAIGEFLEWLTSEKQIVLAYWDADSLGNERLSPQPKQTVDLLAEHFGIDQKALEQEKRAILAMFS